MSAFCMNSQNCITDVYLIQIMSRHSWLLGSVKKICKNISQASIPLGYEPENVSELTSKNTRLKAKKMRIKSNYPET